MADPLGVTLGVLGLAGIFSTVVEIWSFVDAGQGYSEDFSYLKTRLDNQKEILVKWGRDLGFYSEAGYDKRLDEPRMRPRIEETLLHMKRIFSNTSELSEAYGIKLDEVRVDGVVHSSGSLTMWRSSYERFRATLRRNQKKASFVQVTKWSVRDSPKFRTMVDQISELINDLKDLTKNIASKSPREDVKVGEANSIDGINSFTEIQPSIPWESSQLETKNLLAVEAGYAETITSGPNRSQNFTSDISSHVVASTDTTFYTGKTRQTKPSVANTTAEGHFILDVDEIQGQVEGLRECAVCMSDFSVEARQPTRSITSSCKHDQAICVDCIARSIRNDIQTAGLDRICCPECRTQLNDEDVRFFADPDTIILYEQKKQRDALDLHANEPQPQTQVIFEWNDQINETIKRCPECGCSIEKFMGCDHTICTKCRYEFCWSCSVNYVFIRKEGNHRHKKSCDFYFDREYLDKE